MGLKEKYFFFPLSKQAELEVLPTKLSHFCFWFGLVFWCSAVVLLRFCEFFGHIHFWIKRSCEKSIAKIKLQSNGLL